MDVQEQEIGDMLDDFIVEETPEVEETPSMDETPLADAPVEEELPVEEEPEPEEEEPDDGDDEPIVDDETPPVEESPVENIVDDEPVVDDAGPSMEEINQRLVARIEELSSKLISGVPAPPMDTPKVPTPTGDVPAVVVPDVAVEPVDYMAGIEVGDLADDPAKLNTVLNKVVNDARADAANSAVEQVLRAVPEMMVGYMARYTAQTNMVKDFYRENPDLERVKSTVAAVANDIHAKNTDWSVEQIFAETANQTRNMLGLKKTAKGAVKQTARKPAFVKQRGSRVKEPELTGLQKEINELMI